MRHYFLDVLHTSSTVCQKKSAVRTEEPSAALIRSIELHHCGRLSKMDTSLGLPFRKVS